MIGHKDVLFVFIVGMFVNIAVPDADQKEPDILPNNYKADK